MTDKTKLAMEEILIDNIEKLVVTFNEQTVDTRNDLLAKVQHVDQILKTLSIDQEMEDQLVQVCQ